MRPAVLFVVLWVLWLSTGCGGPLPGPATRPATPPPGARLLAADALVRAGCLDCLLEAYREYEALLVHPVVGRTAVLGAIRAATLIALRDRELGTAEYGHMARARELAAAPEVPPDLARLIDIADLMPSAGRPPVTDAQVADSLRYSRNREEWTAWVRSHAADDELFGYVWVRMGCESAAQPVAGDEALHAAGPAGATPLLAFKEAISCSRGNTARLQAVLDREPRFKEVYYFLGFAALGGQVKPGVFGRPDLEGADRHFTAAYQWRQDWAALTSAIGGVAMTAEDFDRALLFYGRTLEMVPDHGDAMLGQVRALTYLSRPLEAIAITDRLIAAGRNLGDARYWRALNETHLGSLEQAWDDIELAAKLLVNSDVPKLAGVVAFRRRDVAVARTKFEEARRLRPTDCETGFYLQTVLSEQREWANAVEVASAAAACFDGDEAQLLREIEEMRASTASPDRRQRVILRREQQIGTNARMRSTALFNAAAASFNLGRRTEARSFAERVADDEQFGARAREILTRLN